MKKQILKVSIKMAIKHDPELAAKLAKANKVALRTIDRWRLADDEQLTTASNLKLIREYIGDLIPASDPLTEEREIEVAQS